MGSGACSGFCLCLHVGHQPISGKAHTAAAPLVRSQRLARCSVPTTIWWLSSRADSSFREPKHNFLVLSASLRFSLRIGSQTADDDDNGGGDNDSLLIPSGLSSLSDCIIRHVCPKNGHAASAIARPACQRTQQARCKSVHQRHVLRSGYGTSPPPILYCFRSSSVPLANSHVACWASVGYNTAGCAAVEASLRTCMDTKKTRKTWPNNVNYHLGRFQKRLNGAVKHKGSKD